MSVVITTVGYNTAYRVICKHPDGRLLATRFNAAGLYVVDNNLALISTLNNTLPIGVTHAVVLTTGTLVAWGSYISGASIYRLTGGYATYATVHTGRANTMPIERSIDVSPTDIMMYAEYSYNGGIAGDELRTDPTDQKVYRGSNDGQTWTEVVSINRNAQFVGDTLYVRHLHCCRYDRFTDKFWISSGDGLNVSRLDGPPHATNESFGFQNNIWNIDSDGSNFTLVGNGSQQWRTTSFAFTAEYVIWGTDLNAGLQLGPTGQSRFKRLRRSDNVVEDTTNVVDTVRLLDELIMPDGAFLLANRSYEFGEDSTGRIQLLWSWTPGGAWQEAKSWLHSGTVFGASGVFYNWVHDGSTRLYGVLINFYEENGTTLHDTPTSIIMDIGWVPPPLQVTIDTATVSLVSGDRYADSVVSLSSPTATFGTVTYPTSTTWSAPVIPAAGTNVITASVTTEYGTSIAEATVESSLERIYIRLLTLDGLRYLPSFIKTDTGQQRALWQRRLV